MRHSYLQKHKKVEDANLKRVREDLQNRVDYLRKQADVCVFGVSNDTEFLFILTKVIKFIILIMF